MQVRVDSVFVDVARKMAAKMAPGYTWTHSPDTDGLVKQPCHAFTHTKVETEMSDIATSRQEQLGVAQPSEFLESMQPSAIVLHAWPALTARNLEGARCFSDFLEDRLVPWARSRCSRSGCSRSLFSAVPAHMRILTVGCYPEPAAHDCRESNTRKGLLSTPLAP